MAFLVLPKKSNISYVHKELACALASNGFFASKGVLADRYYDKSDPSSQTFFVYGRSFEEDGSTNSKSAFNICVLDSGRRLRVWFSNPDESAQAANFGYSQYIRYFSFSAGNSAKFVKEVVDAVLEASSLKPASSYRFFIHNHLAELGGVLLNNSLQMYDDGCSSSAAFLYNLVLSHADFAAITSHNHFLHAPWKRFSSEASKYGITLVAGFEATLPLHEFEPWLKGTPEGKAHNPNGPHIVLLFESAQLASEFWSRYFSGRPIYKYAPTASAGVELSAIYDCIDKNYRGQIARLVAHPVCDVSLPDVGLFNRVAKGEIDLQTMEQIFLRSSGIAVFNPTVDSKPIDFDLYRMQVEQCSHFSAEEKLRRKRNINEAEEFIRQLLRNVGLEKLTPNNINFALALHFSRKHTVAYFDTDSHNFDWGYTDLGAFNWMIKSMGLFAAGHNSYSFESLPTSKPSAADVVHFLAKERQDGFWSYTLFSQIKDGEIQIAQQRRESSFAQKIFNALEKAYYYIKQIKRLGSDTAQALSHQGSLHEPLVMLRGSIPGTIPK
ncbi:MAG: hypothetical protein N3G80_00165 [Candidatus Micrarchaeota archaeon]|nr:hypothetical protein [Candidatus Micrarchaeota archaeon]